MKKGFGYEAWESEHRISPPVVEKSLRWGRWIKRKESSPAVADLIGVILLLTLPTRKLFVKVCHFILDDLVQKNFQASIDMQKSRVWAVCHVPIFRHFFTLKRLHYDILFHQLVARLYLDVSLNKRRLNLSGVVFPFRALEIICDALDSNNTK